MKKHSADEIHDEFSRMCPSCGYDLAGHGLPTKCPECGAKATEALLAEQVKGRVGFLMFLQAVWPIVFVVIGVPCLFILANLLARVEVNLGWPVFAILIGLGILYLPVTAGRALGVAFLPAKSRLQPRGRKGAALEPRALVFSLIMLIWAGLVILFLWAVIWLANFDGR